VNKLLGLLVLALAFTLTMGTVGCNPAKEKDKDKEKEKTTAEKAKADNTGEKAKAKKEGTGEGDKEATIKVKAAEGDGLALKKTGKTKLTVELEDAAPAELTLKATAKDVKGDMLSGEGKIKKGEKSGDIDITTAEAPATVTDINVEITGEKVKKSEVKYKVKEVK